MKNIILFLLISLATLFACQNTGQQERKDDVAPIDSLMMVNNNREDTVLSDSILAMTASVLPDSVKIYLTASQFTERIVFSINRDKESFIEFDPEWSTMSGRTTLSENYSNQILKRAGIIFLEHKAPVIIAKKSHYPIAVEGDYPTIRFVIYHDGKTIDTKDFVVSETQGYYEITYSTYFLRLFNMLFTKAKALCELYK